MFFVAHMSIPVIDKWATALIERLLFRKWTYLKAVFLGLKLFLHRCYYYCLQKNDKHSLCLRITPNLRMGKL